MKRVVVFPGDGHVEHAQSEAGVVAGVEAVPECRQQEHCFGGLVFIRHASVADEAQPLGSLHVPLVENHFHASCRLQHTSMFSRGHNS